jgi:hypothetical protein
MLRLLRYLPVIVPVVTGALRNPTVRSVLHLKPLNPDTSHKPRR